MKKPNPKIIYSVLGVLVLLTFLSSYRPATVNVYRKPVTSDDLTNIEDAVTKLPTTDPVNATYIENKLEIETIVAGDGKTSTGLMLNGAKSGLWSYYKDGHLYQKITFVNDVMNGYVVVYDEMGNKLSEGEYSYGEQSGVWHVFNGGKLVQVECYENGKRISHHLLQ